MPQREFGKNCWAVLIGINGYHESLGALSFCVNDAKLMQQTLASDVCGFPAEQVLLLTDDQSRDRQPTYGNIHSWLGAWLSRPGPDDLVLVYFAGHGREVSGSALLVPVDATLDSLPITGIPIPYVRDLLERCKAGQKVLILDACHSGAGRDVSAMTSSFRSALELGKGLYVIASCDAGQISYEWPEEKHGVFTYFLTRGIRGEALPETDGTVSLDSVYDWTQRKVTEWTAGRRVRQEPVRICRVKGRIALATRRLTVEQELTRAREEISVLRNRAAGLEHDLQERSRRIRELESANKKPDKAAAELDKRVGELSKENTLLRATITRMKAGARGLGITVFPPTVPVKIFLDYQEAEEAVREGTVETGLHTLTVVPQSLRWGTQRFLWEFNPDNPKRTVVKLRRIFHTRIYAALAVLFAFCMISSILLNPIMSASQDTQVGMQFLWTFLCVVVTWPCFFAIKGLKTWKSEYTFSPAVTVTLTVSFLYVLAGSGLSCGVWFSLDKMWPAFRIPAVAALHFMALGLFLVCSYPEDWYRKRGDF